MFVKIENLNKIYQSGEKRQRVLDDLSLSLDKGKIYVLLGPSGSGKSTLLNIIGGLEEAEGGTVKVDGKDILSLNTTALAKYRRDYIGYVFQFYNLIQNLTVKENVDVCSYLGNPSMDINEVMERVGLKEHINKFPNQLSGGQQQRVAIARAIVKNPSILLCDEPTGALDRKSALDILKIFEMINKQYSTLIFIVTHNEAIALMADDIVQIRDGRIRSHIVNENKRSASEIDW